MFRSVRLWVRFFTYPVRAVRRRLRTALVVAVLILTVAVIGGLQYVRHQWRAAQAALADERPQEALDRLTICLIAWPRNPEVYLLAARAARLSGDLSTAEAHLTRCLKLYGSATEAVQLEFLLLRVQGGEVDEVAGLLIDAVEKGHPEAPMILDTLARAYMRTLRYRLAYACLTKWIELHPDAAKAFTFRGWVLERLNNPKAAMADYSRALELNPDLILVRLRVAEMYLEDKQALEALPHLDRLYRQVPNDPMVQARLGMCRFLEGRGEEARPLMESAVIHLPKDPALLVCLASLDLQDGRGADAERRLRIVLEADPSDTEALFVLASALKLQGRTKEAADVLADHETKRVVVDRINDLLKDVADSPKAGADDYAEIGRLFFQIERNKLGIYWAERALELNPTNQPAHQALTKHYERMGELDKAAAHRRNIRSGDETSPPAKTPSKN